MTSLVTVKRIVDFDTVPSVATPAPTLQKDT